MTGYYGWITKTNPTLTELKKAKKELEDQINHTGIGADDLYVVQLEIIKLENEKKRLKTFNDLEEKYQD